MLSVPKYNSGVRRYEIGGGWRGMRAVRVEIITSLMLVVPAVSSESRLVSIWMVVGLTN